MPDWSDEDYTVESVSKGRNEPPMTHISHQPIIDRTAMHLLRDPNNTLKKEENVYAQRAAAGSTGKLNPYTIVYHEGK
ncbi:MAG: hypothetical protein ACKPKO_36230 [Candidatus Fonsibacter sp.]